MTELESLIVSRAAAMAATDGVGVQVVHVFGATSQINAELATARDRLIAHPGQIADVLSALFDAEDAAEPLDPVEAAHKAADKAEAAALEAAQRADDLRAEAERLKAEREAEEAAEAERLVAEQAAAESAEAERLAAEQAAAEAQGEGEPAAPEQEQGSTADGEAAGDAPEQEQSRETASPAPARPKLKVK